MPSVIRSRTDDAYNIIIGNIGHFVREQSVSDVEAIDILYY